MAEKEGEKERERERCGIKDLSQRNDKERKQIRETQEERLTEIYKEKSWGAREQERKKEKVKWRKVKKE